MKLRAFKEKAEIMLRTIDPGETLGEVKLSPDKRLDHTEERVLSAVERMISLMEGAARGGVGAHQGAASQVTTGEETRTGSTEEIQETDQGEITETTGGVIEAGRIARGETQAEEEMIKTGEIETEEKDMTTETEMKARGQDPSKTCLKPQGWLRRDLDRATKEVLGSSLKSS